MNKNQMIWIVLFTIIVCAFTSEAGKFKSRYSKRETETHLEYAPLIPLFQKEKRNNSEDVLRSITTQTWNTANENWQDTINRKFSYENGNLVEEDTYVWSKKDKKWKNYQKTEISYNSKKNITSIGIKIWIPDSAKWIDLVLEQFTYDDSEELVEESLRKENYRLIYGKKDVEPGLHDLEKQTNTFKDGHLEKSVIKTAYPFESRYELEKYITIKYTWDDNEQLTMELIQQWASVVYMDKIKKEYYYDSKGLLKKERQSLKEGKDWVPITSSEYTYNDYDSMETRIIKIFDTTKTEYINYGKESNEYNSEKIVVLTTSDRWAKENWEAYDKTEFTYENNLLVEEVYKVAIQGNWVSAVRYLYKYTTPIKNNLYKHSMNQGLHYSILNLTTCSILEFSVSVPSVVSVDIYDMRGRYISSLVKNRRVDQGFNRIVWDRGNSTSTSTGNSIAPGTYYFGLKVNGSYNLKKTMITNY